VLGALAILLVTVVALSLLAVRWVTRPLSALAAAATRLGRDLHAAPLPETGPDEVVHAARAFNTMQARITRYLEDRSRTLAALSHDLKTPLTRLRLRAEALEPAELRAQVLQDLAEMHAMTVSTLDFLRGGDEREPVQPVDLLALAESLKADAEELGQEVQVLGSPGAPFRARPLALKRCLTNLVDNAVRYGGRAAIHLEEAPGALLVRVTDEGPGIPEAEIERVFEPFYRLEGSRGRQTGGSGLGLTIARNLARAHGGELTLRNRPAGGLEAVLTLPQ
jgi:signal transduction histidine kinase